MDTKIIDNYYFEMFSPEGEKECKKLVKKIHSKVGGTKRITRDELLNFIQNEIKQVSEKHNEIYDTEPSYHIMFLSTKICKEFGYNYEFSRYDVS